MSRSPSAGPFALLEIKLDVDTQLPFNDVWLPGIFPVTIEDQGNGILERVIGNDGQIRVLRDGFYDIRFQAGVIEQEAGVREYNAMRVLVNGTPVPGMERVHYLHVGTPSSATIEGSVRLSENDIISTEVRSYIDTNEYQEELSRLEVKLLHLL